MNFCRTSDYSQSSAALAYYLMSFERAKKADKSFVFIFFKYSIEQLQKNVDLGRYFAVLKRAQDYIQCIPCSSDDHTLLKVHLSVTAWEALCRLKAIQYKRAYKNCFQLRYELRAPGHEVKAALDRQVQLAEQCTACQKKLYLVRNWQRRLLHQLKRPAGIVPEGYQAIRCI